MKIKILFVISLFIIGGLFLAQRIIAQEQTDTAITEAVAADEEITADDLEVSEPTILPDNPLYPAKNLWWKVRTKLTFNPVKKAELQLKIANSKLLEVKKLAQKTGKDEVLKRALQNYQGEMEIVQNRIEVFKEKAGENPKIDKFLDNYTDKAIKQQKLMTRLEQQLVDKPEVLDKIRQNKEKSLEHFWGVIQKLEDKDKIADRLQKNLDNVSGSKYKNFKNLEVLLELENKVPEQAKDAIRKAQENALKRLQGDLDKMSSEDQAKFKDYLDRISGNQSTKLQIIEKLKEQKPSQNLQNNLNQIRNRIKEKIKEKAETCKDLCGDGVCQEIVCMAIGCPCAETPETCPEDCK